MKKKLVVGAVILILLVIGGGLMAVNFKKPSSMVSPMGPQPAPATEVKLLTWEDPAGFKFDYPAEVKINNHPEDKISYANLELTAIDHKGQIKISMVDNSFKTLEDWQKSIKLLITDIAEIKLGNQPALQLNGDSVSPVVAAIDGDALVLIQGFFGEEPYWQPIYNQILTSFEFIPLASEPTKPAAKSGSAGGSSGGVIDEGEEIIE